MIVPNLHEIVVEAPDVATSVKPGQFVIVRADDTGERCPLSVADYDPEKGTVTSIFQEVGETTSKLALVNPGETIPTYAGPLGVETELGEFGTVVMIGGCYGIGSIYPIGKALKEMGNHVIVIIEARSNFLVYWADRHRDYADKVHVISRDGTIGHKGHVTGIPDILNREGEKADRVIANGCTFMMKRIADLTRPMGIRTIVSMNPIMIDGTGMCGVCRLTVDGETKFACVDGPDFDAHLIDWEEFLQRRKTYNEEETEPLRRSGSGISHTCMSCS